MIAKTATNPERFRRPVVPFPSARAAFAAYLRALNLAPHEQVLLPAYIGWSAREGSGVFDPIRETGVAHGFYRMTRDLTVDLGHLESALRGGTVRVVVVIHYFGWPDPNLARIAELAKAYGASLLEDEAHAMFSDLVGGVCGRFGESSIYSLHKMLPLRDGGLIAFNGPALPLTGRDTTDREPFAFDFQAISRARRENAAALMELLEPLHGRVDPLWSVLPAGVVPQTLPVIIREANRDVLYEKMNAAGFGVVSLYHTMVDAIRAGEFPDAHWLSRHVMNLPVHQDVDPGELGPMVAQLGRLT